MEITRDNCAEWIPRVSAALKECSFFSIDFEFSGTGDKEDPLLPGSGVAGEIDELTRIPEAVYATKAAKVEKLSLMQVGISVFKEQRSDSTWLGETIRAGLLELFAKHDREEVLKDLEGVISFDVAQRKLESFRVAGFKERAEALRRVLVDLVPTTSEQIETTTGDRDSGNAMEPFRRYCQTFEAVEKCERIGDVIQYLKFWVASSSESPEAVAGSKVTSYTAQTFFAYLFPQSISKSDTIALNVETVGEFLVDKTNIDFNKWIREGLRFTTISEYQKHRMKAVKANVSLNGTARSVELNLNALKLNPNLQPLSPFTPAEADYLRWVAKLNSNCVGKDALVRVAAEVIAFSRSDELESKKDLSVFVAEDIISDLVNHLKEIGLKRQRGSKKLFRRQEATTVNTFDSSLAGSALLQLLVEASQVHQTPMVTHNGFSDLMFFARTLFGSLPSSYQDFKRIVHALFPQLYDTRTLSCHPSLQHLGSLRGRLDSTHETLGELMKHSVVVTEEGTSVKALKLHNAGYDAFVTGELYLYTVAALRQQGVHLPPLCSITPLYSSIWSSDFSSEKDVLLHRSGAPIFYIQGEVGEPFFRRYKAHAQKHHLTVSTIRTNSGGMIYFCDEPNQATTTNKIRDIFATWFNSENLTYLMELIDYASIIDDTPQNLCIKC